MKVTVNKVSPDLKKVGYVTTRGDVILFLPEDECDLLIRGDGARLVESCDYEEKQALFRGDSITIDF